MTTKPKARKFRIRRSSSLSQTAGDDGPARDPSAAVRPPQAGPRAVGPAAAAAERAETASSEPRSREGGPKDPANTSAQPTVAASSSVSARAADTADALPHGAVPTVGQNANISSAKDVESETEIAAIRKEGLTGRQLRMARRLAQKHGLAPVSDFDAVRQLRAQGINPFERSTMLELVVPTPGEGDGVKLPKTVEREHGVPAARPDEDEDPRIRRATEISDIQRDIARRRRRKVALLAARLAFFVGLPTMLAGYYYFDVATPMYATHSQFVIQKAELAGGAGGLGGLFSGTSIATSQDSITVQSYLQSRDAMMRLDEDLGFKASFSDPSIDPIQRLPEDASNEQAYDLYQHNVEIGYDPTEGIIKMEVVAPDPGLSAEWSRRLIDYAEEQVDSLTERLRADQMAGARENFEEAEAKMEAAQARVLDLQEKLGVLDPASEQGGLMSQITTFETQLAEKRLQLQQLLDNRRPNAARVEGVRGDIGRLENLIADMRGQLTNSGGKVSLAAISGQLKMAEVDLQTRTMMMQQALQQMETARIEANRQSRYLSMGVAPIAPDEATYPRAFENTLLAFLIFSGIYLMCSFTASILREQVSS